MTEEEKMNLKVMSREKGKINLRVMSKFFWYYNLHEEIDDYKLVTNT